MVGDGPSTTCPGIADFGPVGREVVPDIADAARLFTVPGCDTDRPK